MNGYAEKPSDDVATHAVAEPVDFKIMPLLPAEFEPSVILLLNRAAPFTSNMTDGESVLIPILLVPPKKLNEYWLARNSIGKFAVLFPFTEANATPVERLI